MLDLDVSPITSTGLEWHTSKDPVLSKVLINIQKDWNVNSDVELQPFLFEKTI